MRGIFIHGPGDVRVKERDSPEIRGPSEAVIKIVATCVCGSDLCPYRGPDTPCDGGNGTKGEVARTPHCDGTPSAPLSQSARRSR